LKRLPIAMMMMFAVMLGSNMTLSGYSVTMVPSLMAAEAVSMDRVRLQLKKLRDAMSSMQDLDELEKAGMPKSDVDRMRRAMQSKITDMMNDAMQSIRAL